MSDGVRDYNAEVEIVNVDEAEKMRRAGKTYAEIAAYFGCSRQAVHGKLKAHNRNRRRYLDIFESCPYVGLRRYMLSHKDFRISDLSIVLFGSSNATPLAKTRGMLQGRNTLLSISNIKRMESFTGMPCSELFRRDDE